jgi:hypothetical protein
MMTAPAKAASTSCWETEVRLIDPFWTPQQAGASDDQAEEEA